VTREIIAILGFNIGIVGKTWESYAQWCILFV